MLVAFPPPPERAGAAAGKNKKKKDNRKAKIRIAEQKYLFIFYSPKVQNISARHGTAKKRKEFSPFLDPKDVSRGKWGEKVYRGKGGGGGKGPTCGKHFHPSPSAEKWDFLLQDCEVLECLAAAFSKLLSQLSIIYTVYVMCHYNCENIKV